MQRPSMFLLYHSRVVQFCSYILLVFLSVYFFWGRSDEVSVSLSVSSFNLFMWFMYFDKLFSYIHIYSFFVNWLLIMWCPSLSLGIFFAPKSTLSDSNTNSSDLFNVSVYNFSTLPWCESDMNWVETNHDEYIYSHSIPIEPFCFSLPIMHSENYMRYSTFHYKIDLDYLLDCRLIYVF